MTKNSTEDKRSSDNVGNVVGDLGNLNIRGCHIKYFEDRIIMELDHTTDDIASAPNYYAWLWLMAEHTFWEMKTFCYWHGEMEETNLDRSYNPLIKEFYRLCKSLNLGNEDELKTIFEYAVKILEIRHAMVHTGFPNVIPATFKEKRPKPGFPNKEGKEEFTEDNTREVITWSANPKNFDDIKKEFASIMDCMRRAPKREVNVDSLFSVSIGGGTPHP